MPLLEYLSQSRLGVEERSIVDRPFLALFLQFMLVKIIQMKCGMTLLNADICVDK